MHCTNFKVNILILKMQVLNYFFVCFFDIIHVFKANHLVLDTQLVCFLLSKTISPFYSILSLPVIFCVGLKFLWTSLHSHKHVYCCPCSVLLVRLMGVAPEILSRNNLRVNSLIVWLFSAPNSYPTSSLHPNTLLLQWSLSL